MADEVGICNSALSKIGARRITSLAQGSKNANFCAEQYDKLRQRLLRRHLWNFAKGRQKLARLSTSPVFGFKYAYQLPADWLRVVSVHDNEAAYGGVRYKIEGRTLLADHEEVYLVYVRNVTDANVMTADFREALALCIAKDGAIPLVQSNTLKADIKDDFKSVMREARSTDAIEDFPDQMPDGSWSTHRDHDRSQYDSWAW